MLLVGAALLGGHFTMSALSQAPLSPAKVRYEETVSSYLEPYFAQNWMLFAPDPITDDRGILARAKCSDGSVTDFYDVTHPHIKAAQDSRFFPSRMSRLVTNGLQAISNHDELMNRLRQNSLNEKKPLIPATPFEKSSRDETITFLSRYSMGQMPTPCGDGQPSEIQVRMYIHQLPPWSQRKSPKAEGKVEVEDFAWRKVKELR
ncbi:DUF5819 family protein [Streptomyces sp. NPDC051219]|uniref:DUF5819 family protein n=1 Tax=Streptomyces sp. NPDC051219 TaxID=3155283 RepID=UPI00341DEDA3